MFRTSCSSWAPGAHQSLLRSKDPHLFASYGFRPGPTTHLRASVAGSRQASSRLPPSIETGHIKLRENEGILFFSNVFPPRLQWLLRLLFIGEIRSFEKAMKRLNKPQIALSDSLDIVKRALPLEPRLEIREVLPRFSEGGIFVKYSREPGVDDAEIERAVKENLEQNEIVPWFNPFQRVEVARVLGQPWIEDLYRFPGPKLRVEFLPTSPDKTAAELTPEVLYSLFRRYGKLVSVERQPSTSPITPRYAFVEFTTSRNAIVARNCVHGFTVSEKEGGGKTGTTLKITYERRVKFSWFKDWMLGHPRIVIPAIAALLAAITVVVFDPIRTFFIKMRIKSTLRMEENAIWAVGPQSS